MTKRYSKRELQIGAQALNRLIVAYLRGEDGAKRDLEPLIRQYLGQRGEPRPRDEDLAMAAWQIWLHEGSSLPKLIDGAAKVRAEHGLPPLWADEDERDILLGQIRRCVDPVKRAQTRGRSTAESTAVATVYRLLSGRVPDTRRGVRDDELRLIKATRDNAWLIARAPRMEFVDVPTGELVTKKTKAKRHH